MNVALSAKDGRPSSTKDTRGFDVEWSALQAFGDFSTAFSQPVGLGYLNGWTFGPEDNSDDYSSTGRSGLFRTQRSRCMASIQIGGRRPFVTKSAPAVDDFN